MRVEALARIARSRNLGESYRAEFPVAARYGSFVFRSGGGSALPCIRRADRHRSGERRCGIPRKRREHGFRLRSRRRAVDPKPLRIGGFPSRSRRPKGASERFFFVNICGRRKFYYICGVKRSSKGTGVPLFRKYIRNDYDRLSENQGACRAATRWYRCVCGEL